MGNDKQKKQYYHSYDWGIVDNPTLNRSVGYKFLNSINLLTPILHTFTAEYLLSLKDNDLSYIMKNVPYLAICETISSNGPKIGSPNIISINQIHAMARKAKRHYGKESIISLLQQIKEIKTSFVATALSDGKGMVLIEILKGTVDSRNLTSKGANPKNLERGLFWDKETFEITDFSLFTKMVSIYKDCCWNRGYYEITCGITNMTECIFYTYYSSNEMYGNLLKMCSYDFELQIRSKLLALNSGLYPF